MATDHFINLEPKWLELLEEIQKFGLSKDDFRKFIEQKSKEQKKPKLNE